MVDAVDAGRDFDRMPRGDRVSVFRSLVSAELGNLQLEGVKDWNIHLLPTNDSKVKFSCTGKDAEGNVLYLGEGEIVNGAVSKLDVFSGEELKAMRDDMVAKLASVLPDQEG